MAEAQAFDEHTLDLLLELAHGAVPFSLTPTEERLMEQAVSGALPGDIRADNLVPTQIVRKRLDRSGMRQWPASEIEVTYFQRTTKEWGRARIEILSPSDISFLAQAFQWLLDHEPAGGPDGA